MYKLREIERKDLKTINKWRNDDELTSLIVAPFRYINYSVDEKWFENYMNNRSTNIRCSIVDDDDVILGIVSLIGIDSINRSASLGIMIGENDLRNKGIGTFAIKEMLNHAFNNVNLNRIELTVLSTNERAIHVYEKCGFVFEGKKRSCAYKNGEYIDTCIYSILKSDYISGEKND